MTLKLTDAATSTCDEHGAAMTPPRWAMELAGGEKVESTVSGGVTMRISRGAQATLISASAPNTGQGSADELQRLATRVYRAVRRAVDGSNHPHIVRMWNWIPAIHRQLCGDQNCYMVFNAARFAAMREWFGGIDAIAVCAPAASGVGSESGALVVQAMSMARPGDSVGNPRQSPAWQYSRDYGLRPPCFARATRVRGIEPVLFISGTAAILGEQSRYVGDLAAQFELTLENLRQVIIAGDVDCGLEPLNAVRQARVYIARPADLANVKRWTRNAFRTDADLQFCRADLCRADLLVEIEAAAWSGESRKE